MPTLNKPETLIAFRGKQAVKEKYMRRLRAHYKADEIVQGTAWERGKGCAVGCTLHRYEHKAYETELGIPVAIAHLEDRLFESLPLSEAKEFPISFLDSIQVGADLSGVVPRFLHWLIIDDVDGVINFADRQDSKHAIQSVGDLWQRVIEGSTVTSKEWDAAAQQVDESRQNEPANESRPAVYAARASLNVADAYRSTSAAAYAVTNAAYATYANASAAASAGKVVGNQVGHCEKMAAKLLELLDAAPVVDLK